MISHPNFFLIIRATKIESYLQAVLGAAEHTLAFRVKEDAPHRSSLTLRRAQQSHLTIQCQNKRHRKNNKIKTIKKKSLKKISFV